MTEVGLSDHDFRDEAPPEVSLESKVERCVFTLWVKDDNDDESYEPERLEAFIKYLRWGCETSPTTGKRHYQGYMIFTKKLKYRTIHAVLKQLFGRDIKYKPDGTGGFWVKAMRGSIEANDRYIEKEGCFHSWGERPTGTDLLGLYERQAAGGRKSIDEFAAKLAQGQSLREVALAHPSDYIRYSRGAEKLAGFVARPLRRAVGTRITRLRFGPTQCGKTYDAVPEGATTADCFLRAAASNGFMDGYVGQRRVILDEFRGAASGVTVGELLQLLNRSFNCLANVKGSVSFWDPDNIDITTNEHPWGWYDWSGRVGSYDALMERFDYIYVYHPADVHRGQRVITALQRGTPEFAAFCAWRPTRVEPLALPRVGVHVVTETEQPYNLF